MYFPNLNEPPPGYFRYQTPACVQQQPPVPLPPQSGAGQMEQNHIPPPAPNYQQSVAGLSSFLPANPSDFFSPPTNYPPPLQSAPPLPLPTHSSYPPRIFSPRRQQHLSSSSSHYSKSSSNSRKDDSYRGSSSRHTSSKSSVDDKRHSRSSTGNRESSSSNRDRDRERDKDRERDRERERERDKDRGRERDKNRVRDKDRERDRNRSDYRRDSNDKRRRSPSSRESSRPRIEDRYKTEDADDYSQRKYSNSERDILLANWRKDYCETSEDITKKLAELSKETSEKERWIRSSPADIYYNRATGNLVEASKRLELLCDLFEVELVKRSERTRQTQAPYVPPPRKRANRFCRHKNDKCTSSDSSSDEEVDLEEDCTMEELSRKMNHPYRLHADLWFNEKGEMNDGPFCRCSAKSRRTGIRHGIYPGENGFTKCLPNSNNADKLYHYRITISPPTNFLTKTPTIIKYDQHEFIFEGFSLLSHVPLTELPTCKVIRFNIEYTILYVEEKMPENFTIRELDLFFNYLFIEVLELVDFNLKPGNLPETEDCCPFFHFLPRFVRDVSENGKEVLAMSEVLKYLLDNSGPLVDRRTLEEMNSMNQSYWLDYVDNVKGMVVTNPSVKPCSARVDQLDRNVSDLPECKDDNGVINPVIVHFGIRPPQLSYAGNPEYQKAWRDYVKFRHLVANMSKPSYEDKRKLEAKEMKLQEMRMQGRMKRNITVAISSRNFHRTGIMCDMVQHAMLIPVLACHLRFHISLDVLEKNIDYKFQNRYLLQLALTHPSYKENFGTNPDHARNSLTNCGIRQPEYGDRKIHYMNTRKRGINTLINIMSRFGKEFETDSNICHNERLEFLGDAVVEFLSSIHLFFMFPDLEEGGLATYRAAIVQNQHLAVLAKKLHLEEFMLYAHGSDLCHELELRHAMANCFEALMGALLLDGGIEVADTVFAHAFFMEHEDLRTTWIQNPIHPLQEQEPKGDRKWIDSYKMLQNLVKFEESIGVRFNHIRLLARSFTDRSIGFTHLTLGSNQRLEFLGDTVLQLICSEFLYRHFPEHHEGHLSLLRSSLVNNRTQAVVCDDLGMTQFAVYSNPKNELKTKDRADLLEAFLGALYVDKGLEYCQTFCQVCLFPRLKDFIMNQDWNDPKSKLQQCCLTLRTMDGGEPDIPVYKVIESKGPTNTRVYTVAVYFREKRLACATGHSIQQAEMNAAKKALDNSQDLFLQLDHQKRVIARSMKRQRVHVQDKDDRRGSSGRRSPSRYSTDDKGKSKDMDDSHLPKQYRTREESSSEEINYSSDGTSSKNNPPKSPAQSEMSWTSGDKKTAASNAMNVNDFSSVSESEDFVENNKPVANYKDEVEVYKTQSPVEDSSDLESGEIE